MFPEQNENNLNTSSPKKFTRDPRPSYNSRFYIAEKGGTSQVIVLDRYADLTDDQLNFLDAFGAPQRTQFVQNNKDKSKEIVKSGFAWYEHTLKHEGKFLQLPCGQNHKITPKSRVSLLKQLTITNNSDFQSVMNRLDSTDSEWYFANTIPDDTLNFIVDCAIEAFRPSVRDYYSLALGAKMDDDGVPCRFCEMDRVAKSANKDAQSTSGRKIARTIVNVGLSYKLKDGTEVVNPLQLLTTGAKFDAIVRTLEAEKRGGKKKGHEGLFCCLCEVSRSGAGPSSGDGITWEDTLTPEQVLAYNPNALIYLDKAKFLQLLTQDGHHRFHLLRASAPNMIKTIDDAISAFDTIFPEALWIGNTADYRAITVPRSPSYLRAFFGESEKVVKSLQPTASASKFAPQPNEDDIPF